MAGISVLQDDFLKVEIAFLGATGNCRLAVLTENNGKVQRSSHDFPAALALPLWSTYYFPIGGTAIFSACLTSVSTYANSGSFWGRISVVHGDTSAAQVDDIVAIGFFDYTHPLCYPFLDTNSDMLSTLSVQTGTNAAPAASFLTQTLGPGCIVKPKAYSWKLVTSAAVANRQASLVLADAAGNLIYNVSSGLAVPASTTAVISFAVGYNPTINTVTIQNASMPDIYLPPGTTITMMTNNPQAGDVITDCVFKSAWIPA